MKRNYSRWIVVVCSMFMVFAVTSTDGHAAKKSLLDQQQPNEIGWNTVISNRQEVAQTFSPGFDGYLTQVSVMIIKHTGYDEYTGEPLSPGNIIAEIRTTVGNNPVVPSDEVIASSVLDEAEVSEGILGWYDIFFPGEPSLYAGESYAIVLRTDLASSPDPVSISYPGQYRWYMDSDHVEDPYPFGDMMAHSQGTGYLWLVNEYWNEDATFKTYMVKLKGRDK